MKILIAVPAMDMVHTNFVRSLVGLKIPEGEIHYMIPQATLIYDARNMIAAEAVSGGFDRVLWLDSDMAFDRDLLIRLNARMDEGHDFVTGIYYSRKPPIEPAPIPFDAEASLAPRIVGPVRQSPPWARNVMALPQTRRQLP